MRTESDRVNASRWRGYATGEVERRDLIDDPRPVDDISRGSNSALLARYTSAPVIVDTLLQPRSESGTFADP